MENLHRSLKDQMRKFKIPSDFISKYPDFIQSINDSYESLIDDNVRLENVLEISSKELFESNQSLKKENITKSREAIQAKEHLDRVMDNVNEVIFEVDGNGNFTYLNSAWASFGQEDPIYSLGKNYMNYTDTIDHFDKEVISHIKNKDVKDFKTVFSRPTSDKKLLWWELSASLQRDENDRITGAIGSLVDVTKTKETEKQLILANEAKTNFLSTMSHEIRTPLNAVIAISNILLMDEPKESQIKNLETLKFSSKHLLHLINDILDYNKLMTGNLKLSNEPFSLQKTARSILNSFYFTAEDKNIKLQIEIGHNVPTWVKGDSLRFSQVLTNLIGNAVKFTSEGSVKMSLLSIKNNHEKLKLRIKITDTGIGIPSHKLDTIFDDFTQAQGHTSKRFGGTGLGLAICKKLLNLQDSEIHVESKLGEGTTFWFDLDFDQVSYGYLNSIKPNEGKKLDLTGMKLLVVDDNAMNLLVINQFFDKWNIEYDEAVNGEEAVNKAANANYDVILMDLQMPIKDGYQATKDIRNMGGSTSQTPIIALSATVSNDIIQKVTEAGMNDYLSKPFDPIDLYNKIEKYANHNEHNNITKNVDLLEEVNS